MMFFNNYLELFQEIKKQYKDNTYATYLCPFVYHTLGCDGYSLNKYIPNWIDTFIACGGSDPTKGAAFTTIPTIKQARKNRMNVINAFIKHYEECFMLKTKNPKTLLTFVFNLKCYHNNISLIFLDNDNRYFFDENDGECRFKTKYSSYIWNRTYSDLEYYINSITLYDNACHILLKTLNDLAADVFCKYQESSIEMKWIKEVNDGITKMLKKAL